MATQIQGRGGSLKKAELAGNRYQGAVSGTGFEPVEAVSEEKRAKQKTQAVERENEIKRRALERQQQADTLNLQAQQKAISSKQTLDQKVEIGNLKQEQLYERSIFDLKKNWVTLQDNLKLSEIKAQHTVESTNLKTINSIVQLSTSFAKSYLDYSQQMGEVKEQQAAVKLFFDGGSAKVLRNGSIQERANTDQEVINTKANIEASDGDLSLQNSLNQENVETRKNRIENKKSAYEFARDFPALYRDAWNNSDLQIELADGRVISPGEATTAEEVNAVGLAIAADIATTYGLKDLDADTVYRVVLPKVNEARSQVDTAITAEVIKGNIENAVLAEIEDAREKINAGEHTMQEIFDETYKGIFVSGKHRGDQSAITNETVKELVGLLEANQDVEKLKELKKVLKVPGNKGTALGKISETNKLITEAISRVRSKDHNDMLLSKKEREVALYSAQTTHKEELIAAGNDVEKIKQANIKYENKLIEISGPEALELYQVHAAKDDRYNPQLVGWYLKQINDGKRISEKELSADVAGGMMTEQEKVTVMNASGLTKEGADLIVKPYQEGWSSTLEARIIQGAKLNGLNPTVAGKLVGLVKEDMMIEVNRKMADYLNDFPDASKGDINNQAISIIEDLVKTKIDTSDVFETNGTFNSENYKWISGSRRREALTVKKVTIEVNGEKQVIERLDLTDYSASEIFSFGEFDADPTKDIIFSKDEFANAILSFKNNDFEDVDERFEKLAEYFELTPQQLLKQVAKQRGFDLDAYLAGGSESSSKETSKQLNIFDQKSGVTAIKSFGYSKKGSQALSVVYEVQGLWPEMDKQKLGESLLFMETLQPDAYRILTNPNSSNIQIRRAIVEFVHHEQQKGNFTAVKGEEFLNKFNELFKQYTNES